MQIYSLAQVGTILINCISILRWRSILGHLFSLMKLCDFYSLFHFSHPSLEQYPASLLDWAVILSQSIIFKTYIKSQYSKHFGRWTGTCAKIASSCPDFKNLLKSDACAYACQLEMKLWNHRNCGKSKYYRFFLGSVGFFSCIKYSFNHP